MCRNIGRWLQPLFIFVVLRAEQTHMSLALVIFPNMPLIEEFEFGRPKQRTAVGLLSGLLHQPGHCL
ncbi:hypothetical protein Y1Q_0017830 [Alligator mississippiensis]|uniref:Secreted protein n=1 Tax=Alligator mississippiensis TaxID=8496 RepID=A0A151MPP8_ALLMI|nr:hypothetical protein Y1Q_0017830 [Alligator mississippiensis]